MSVAGAANLWNQLDVVNQTPRLIAIFPNPDRCSCILDGYREMDFRVRTREAASDRTWRSMRLALLLGVSSLTVWAAGPPDAPSFSITEPDLMQAVASPNVAFARYIASLGRTSRSPEWQTVTVEIEASLPGLAKQGRLEAIRRSACRGIPSIRCSTSRAIPS
jgi:hypothetical protein